MAYRGTGTFTVKVIDPHTGRWRLYPAGSVSLDAHTGELLLHQMQKACPRCGCDDVIERLTSGHAYVMNDSGKTVTVYNLDKKEQQHEHTERTGTA